MIPIGSAVEIADCDGVPVEMVGKRGYVLPPAPVAGASNGGRYWVLLLGHVHAAGPYHERELTVLSADLGLLTDTEA